MSLLRITSASKVGEPPSETAGSHAIDSYFERLLKLIPAEAVGIYLIGLNVIDPEKVPIHEVANWTLACVAFVFVMRVIVSVDSPNFGRSSETTVVDWLLRLGSSIQWPAVIIATISFVIWATALGFPVSPWFSHCLDKCSPQEKAAEVVCGGEKLGILALLLWTPIASFIYKGERVGNLAPSNGGRN